MKASLEWIKDYVEVDIPLSSLIDKLNMIGLMVEEWEERDGDVIFDIETHANRPDTLGHMGIAREIAVAFGLRFKEKDWALASTERKTSDLIDIQIRAEELCHRYSGIIIQNLKVEQSPDWLREKIEAMDLKPINNVVDVTNYVLFSTGHPIHAFDLAKLRGSKIIVRRAQKGEILKTLEGEDLTLSPEMLVIADVEKPVALAGIIGGDESAVSETTLDVFIESAWFDPVSVRKTSKEAGIVTEASFRFERGADIAYPPRAAMMAASLLAQLGGKPTDSILDVYPLPRKSRVIVLRPHKISELLGMDIDEDFVQNTLPNLGFHLDVQKEGMWQVEVPSFRIDIEREVDLIEEIVRFYGYDKVPSHFPPLTAPEPPPQIKRERIIKMRQLLSHQGFDEVVNYSFSEPEREALFPKQRKGITIQNPISQRSSLLRTSLLGGLLENIVWNRNRGAEGVQIFEIGNVYFWDDPAASEELMLGLAKAGFIGLKHKEERAEEDEFFFLKGTVEALMTHFRYEPFSFQEDDHPYFEKEFSLALIFKGEKVGFLGMLKSEILESFSLKDTVWAAELNLAILFDKQPQSFHFMPVIKFPSISRDISFLVDQAVSYQDIKRAIEKLDLPYLEKFALLDRFRGPTIPENKISLSFRLVFRHPQRTLQAREIDNLQQDIVKNLNSSFKIQLREGGEIDK